MIKIVLSSFVVLMFLSGCAAALPKLHEAASMGNIDLVKSELAKNPDINAKYLGATPLIMASIRGNLKVVQYLVEQGADIDYVNITYGSTALIEAVASNRPEIVQYLLSRGAKTDARYINSAPIMEQYRGKNALDIAISHQNQKIIDLLTNKKSDDIKVNEKPVPNNVNSSDWR